MNIHGLELRFGHTIETLSPDVLKNRRKTFKIPHADLVQCDGRPSTAVSAIEANSNILDNIRAFVRYIRVLGYKVALYNIPQDDLRSMLIIKYPSIRASDLIFSSLRKSRGLSREDVVELSGVSVKYVFNRENNGISERVLIALQLLMRYGFYLHITPPADVDEHSVNPLIVSLRGKMEEYELDIDDIAQKASVSHNTVRCLLNDEPVSMSDTYKIMEATGFLLHVTEYR
ncbi:hypothetical protein GR7B_00030 [Vibrio phage vB_VcorM_GR7B]|nr:hypothetical protein GR7B_00030 [Vibrio phage vB_VcorM_GR7B]